MATRVGGVPVEQLGAEDQYQYGTADEPLMVSGAGTPDAMSLQSVGGVPSVDTAGSLLPPEAAPPVAPGEAAAPAPTAPEEAGPLTDMWEPVQRGLLETYQAEQKRAEQLREEQIAANERARAQLEYGYQRYADAGQEVMDLAEQQRLRRPPIPTPPVEPAVPQQRFEPFGVGPEKETGMQALQRITMTMGLLAQMGMGMKSGYTRGAMAAFNGALDGWAKGQKIKGDQEWKEYLANVQKLDREWARERQHFDDILRTDAVDLDRAKIKMAIRQTELGYSKELINLTLRDADQRINMFNVERDMLQNLMRNSMTVMTQRLLGDFRNRQQSEIENYHRQQILAQNLTRQLQEQRDRATAAYQQGQLGAGAAARAQSASQHAATLAETKRWHDIQAAKTAGGGVQQQELDNAYKFSASAVQVLNGINRDPAQKAVADAYIGPTASRAGIARGYRDYHGGVPEYTSLKQETAAIEANVKKLIAGKAITGIEAAPILDWLPRLTDAAPDVYWQKMARTAQNIEVLNRKNARTDQAPPAFLTWVENYQPGGGSVGGAGAAPGGRLENAKTVADLPTLGIQQGARFRFDDGKTYAFSGVRWVEEK